MGIPDIADGRRLADLPLVLRMIAARNAEELTIADIAKESGIPATTVARLMDLLETLYLIQRVPAWATNLPRPSRAATEGDVARHRLGRAFGQRERWCNQLLSALFHHSDRHGHLVGEEAGHPSLNHPAHLGRSIDHPRTHHQPAAPRPTHPTRTRN